MEEYSAKKKLFGKEIEIVLYGVESLTAENIIESAHSEGMRLQKIFNFYDPKSELSILNRKKRLKVSNELLEVLKKSLEYCRLTDGDYDISLGETIKKRKQRLEEQKIDYSYKDIEIKEDIVILNHPDMLIDLGSVAKGYIADKIVGVFLKEGILSGFIDARGDIRLFGDKEHIINIQHPREPKKHITAVKIKNQAIATSGDYRQYHDNFNNSHLVGKKDIISATVIGQNLMNTDLFATILCVCSREKRAKLLKAHKHLMALTIDSDLNKEFYNGFETYLV